MLLQPQSSQPQHPRPSRHRQATLRSNRAVACRKTYLLPLLVSYNLLTSDDGSFLSGLLGDIVSSMESDTDVSDPVEFEAKVGRQTVQRQLRSYNRTQIERDIFSELNRFRENPSGYAATLEKKRLPFYKGNELLIKDEQGRDVSIKTKEGERGCEGAISYCRRTSPVRRLEFSEAMSLACKEAVAELGSNGRVLTNALAKLQNLGRFAPGSHTLVKEVSQSLSRFILFTLA